MTTQPHPTLADARAWVSDGIADPDGLDAAGVVALKALDERDAAIRLLETWLDRHIYITEATEDATRTFLQSLKADSREEG